MATPKIIIDLMLYEKYGWTPQQVDEIPKMKMEEIMLALNQKMESQSGITKTGEAAGSWNKETCGNSFDPKSSFIGSGRPQRVVR